MIEQSRRSDGGLWGRARSYLESAKLVGADPYAYLLTATYAALDAPGTVTLPAAPTA